MQLDRFNELALSPIRWAYEAHRQFFVGQSLLPLNEEYMKKFSSCSQDNIKDLAQKVRAITNASMLHFGLAIENSYKTRKIIDGIGTVDEKGGIKGLRTDHNILEMVNEYGLSLDGKQEDVLRSITYATMTGAKYPIAKNLEKQSKFSGRIFGVPHSEPIVKVACIHILRDEPYISIFKNGASSGVDDTA